MSHGLFQRHKNRAFCVTPTAACLVPQARRRNRGAHAIVFSPTR